MWKMVVLGIGFDVLAYEQCGSRSAQDKPCTGVETKSLNGSDGILYIPLSEGGTNS
jgi:hypothetical protein